MTAEPEDQLVVPLGVDERERLNEWAVEIGVPVAELARRLILRYLQPPRDRDDVDQRIGQTLLARAGAMGHVPPDASDKLRQAIRDLGLADEDA